MQSTLDYLVDNPGAAAGQIRKAEGMKDGQWVYTRLVLLKAGFIRMDGGGTNARYFVTDAGQKYDSEPLAITLLGDGKSPQSGGVES